MESFSTAENSERPLVFLAVILRRVRGINRFHNVKLIIWGQQDAWDAARYVALVKEVKEANRDAGSGGGGTRARQENATSLVRKYHNMVLGGKVLAAIRMVTNRGAGLTTRSGFKDRPPRHRHTSQKAPGLPIPLDEDFDFYSNVPNCLDSMPVYCDEECVSKAAACLSGSAGLCGVEAEMLKHWLLRHGVQSERLGNAMANWVDWLSNGCPPMPQTVL